MKLVQQTRLHIPPPNTLLYKMDPKDMPRKTKEDKLRATNQHASIPSKHWDKYRNGEGR